VLPSSGKTPQFVAASLRRNSRVHGYASPSTSNPTQFLPNSAVRLLIGLSDQGV
jgi:hypothetical protein